MTRPCFEQNYSRLRDQFGLNYFGKNKAIQIFELFGPISDPVADGIFSEIIGSKLFSSSNPPDFSAFKNLVEKANSEQIRAKFRQEKAKENLPTPWESIKGDGLTNALKKMGFESVDELVRNNYKPRSGT